MALLIRRTLLLFSCMLLSLGAWASLPDLEQLVKDYHKQDWSLAGREAQLGMLTDIIERAEAAAVPQTAFFAYLELASLYEGNNPDAYKSAINHLDSLFENDHQSLSDSALVNFWVSKGSGLLMEGFFADGLKNMLYAYELAKRENHPILLTSARNGLAMYYTVTGDIPKALALERKVLQEFETRPSKDTAQWVTYAGNLGVVYSWVRDYDSSNVLLRKAIRLRKGNLSDAATNFYYLGRNYLEMEQFDSSAYFLNQAIALEEDKEEESMFLPTLYQHLGLLYNRKGDYERSSEYFSMTLGQLDSSKQFNQLRNAHAYILMNGLKANDNQAGAETFSAYTVAVDSMRKRQNHTLEQQYKVQFETFEKDLAIKDLELQQREDAQTKLILGFLGGLALLLLLFVAFRYRTRQKLLRQALDLEALKAEQAEELVRQKDVELGQQINQLKLRGGIIDQLKSQIENQSTTQDILKTLEQNYIEDQSWDNIIIQFESLHPDFLPGLRARSEKISQNDIKLAILTKLGYSTASMAEVLKISKEGVRKARQRLKDKVGADTLQNISA